MDSRIERPEFAYIRQTTRGRVWKLPGEATKDPGVEPPELPPHANLAQVLLRAVGSRVVGAFFSQFGEDSGSSSSRTHGIPFRPTVFRSSEPV